MSIPNIKFNDKAAVLVRAIPSGDFIRIRDTNVGRSDSTRAKMLLWLVENGFLERAGKPPYQYRRTPKGAAALKEGRFK